MAIEEEEGEAVEEAEKEKAEENVGMSDTRIYVLDVQEICMKRKRNIA